MVLPVPGPIPPSECVIQYRRSHCDLDTLELYGSSPELIGQAPHSATCKENMAKTGSQIAQQIDCEKIRYSKVWEDHKLLMSGINIQPQDNVLCITG